jgi:YD repeat-containing protein
MITRVALCFFLIAALSVPASPQGCSQYLLWGLSGTSSLDPSNPTSAAWNALLAQQEAAHGGGPPSCQYTWLHNPQGFTTDHWYGQCVVYAWTCPTPPPSGPQETGNCPSCNSAGYPINLSNGNVYIQQRDVRVPGLGNGLTLTRIWNSIWPSSQSSFSTGIFGPNWRSTYEERIFNGSDGTIKYARADGSFWSFQLYGNPPVYQVVAPADGRAILSYGSSYWTVTFQNGEQRLFSVTSGSLVDIVDRNGNTTQLSYDATNRLTTVTDPASRHLYFNYGTNSNLVSSVTSDISLSLSYTYDGQGRLITVTKPDLTTVSFQYDSNSRITAVLDNDGKVLESHTYDSYGRGLTSARAGGVEAVTVSYPTQ